MSTDNRTNTATIAGVVATITPVETVGQKATPKQLLVVTAGDRYPEKIAVEFFGDKAIDELTAAVRKGLGQGVSVRVGAYIKGREHSGRYYTSLGYKAGSLEFDEQAAPPTLPAGTSADDDLPF